MHQVALVSVLAVAGCSPGLENDKICAKPPALNNPMLAVGGAGPNPRSTDAKDCIHRWAYRLSGSPDPAAAVVRGVLGACRTPISRWALQNYMDARAIEKAAGGGQPEFWSSETGAATTGERATYEDAMAEAEFRVQQARAGHCRTP
ncbi:MAG: hypothetical protein Q8N10_03455 [Phenylobacterium sp.]|uniref:hypothetical protein n=1 Tax=Phenylobacterium sp. TaxID=1871053 RepID=UPI0027268A7D|nr:hypothetical protein [Phenylobacterium sp.]MDO8912327.1 hypothetical protein [Phenylobacterium sp.]MDP3099539.1 hypothetical protein [Phenylobacterium sp.]